LTMTDTDNNKTCIIISGGDYSPLPKDIDYEYCIACDKGYEYAGRMGIKPDVVIGDFDSYEGDIKADHKDIPVLTFPVEKDDTDTMLAIKHALSLGYNRIILTCALGGRLDHTLANVQSMAYAATHGAVCELYSDSEYLRTLNSETEKSIVLGNKPNSSLSLFALSDKCEGVTIKGAKYNAENVELTNDFPLGVSNAWGDSDVTVSIRKGLLLIVESLAK